MAKGGIAFSWIAMNFHILKQMKFTLPTSSCAEGNSSQGGGGCRYRTAEVWLFAEVLPHVEYAALHTAGTSFLMCFSTPTPQSSQTNRVYVKHSPKLSSEGPDSQSWNINPDPSKPQVPKLVPATSHSKGQWLLP